MDALSRARIIIRHICRHEVSPLALESQEIIEIAIAGQIEEAVQVALKPFVKILDMESQNLLLKVRKRQKR